MRKLDINEFKLCQILGRVFEKSVKLSNLSSPMFIKRFMNYDGSQIFFNKSYLAFSSNEEDIIFEINELYSSTNNKILYSKKEMYWIGYIYGALSFLYNLPAKKVYKLFPAKEVIKYYNIYHTFDIEEAAERMMENIGYIQKDFLLEGIKIYKRLLMLEELKKLIGKKVHVYVDRPLGSKHSKFDDITYKVNYGYIKNLKALDNEYQDAYVLGINKPVKEFDGVVYAIINRTNDSEDKLIVIKVGNNYSNAEIEKYISFQEKYFKHKIIR